MAAPTKTVSFSGYTWEVKNGSGMGPGPNNWNKDNVWVDAEGNLHLKITHRNGIWSCAELYLRQTLGFGKYQFKVIGRPDLLDDNIVFGMFNYGGQDRLNEIDIEFARWGNSEYPMGNYTVYPSVRGPSASHTFEMQLSGDYSTYRFQWSSGKVIYDALHGHQDGNFNKMTNGSWTFDPSDHARVPQNALPVHINMWLFSGHPPKNGNEVEMVVKEFKFESS